MRQVTISCGRGVLLSAGRSVSQALDACPLGSCSRPGSRDRLLDVAEGFEGVPCLRAQLDPLDLGRTLPNQTPEQHLQGRRRREGIGARRSGETVAPFGGVRYEIE